MEDQLNQSMVIEEPVSLGFVANLKKALTLPAKTRKFMLSNMLVVLLPFCLLVLGADLTFVGVMANLVTSIELLIMEDVDSLKAAEILSGIIKGVWLLLGLEIVFLAFYCIVSVFALVTMVYATSRSNIKELFWKTGRLWIRTVVTWFYVTFIIYIFVALALISISLFSLRLTSVPLIILGIMVVTLGTVCYVYLAAVWMFSMVISITALDLNEVVVLEKFEDVIKRRRLQGFVLMLFTSLVSIAIVAASALQKRKTGQGIDTESANAVMMLCYVCLLKLLMFVLYSVYLYECQRRYGEQLEVEARADYVPIATRDILCIIWGMQNSQDPILTHLVTRRSNSGTTFQVLVNANVSPGRGNYKGAKSEVIMVDPLEAKRLATKQMQEIEAEEKLARKRRIEAINGAWAMLGLTAGLVIEGRTGDSILAQLTGYWNVVTGYLAPLFPAEFLEFLNQWQKLHLPWDITL
ncbi:hypothetical protein FRX31_026515 [Thalictrum thalictroides]|uniref:Transmembrane protein n=1 Tax=Thalictrum thalictroides TaxID=46969 RepID=A0A7J6VFL7_THATH|nr:hypothetical protein FRX31_026515 [Thalictrum thalictroides]